MQVNFGGAVCVAGTCTKDAELKYVGEKQTPMCTFSLAVGKRQDTTTIFNSESIVTGKQIGRAHV